MALGETAVLAVELKLNGVTAYSSGIAQAEAATTRLGSSVGSTTGRGLAGAFKTMENAAGGVGKALGHAKNAIGGLLTGPLGVLGLGAGVFGLASFFEGALKKTSDFGLEIEKLTALTGESAQSMGELALVAEKFGVGFDQLGQIVGFAEKTLGKLSTTTAKTTGAVKSAALAHLELQKAQIEATGGSTKHIDALIKERKALDQLAAAHGKAAVGLTKLDALDQQFGLHLVDTHGKVVNFSTELSQVADFYNSSASASQKAFVASTLFGRGYAALIPLLALGSDGLKRAKQAVDDMGLSLGTDTQGALAAYKTALRGVGEAVSVLQVQIGVALAPMITDLANSISLFLEHGGAKQIVQVFKDVAHFAQQVGGVIGGTVIPTLQTFGSVVKGVWDSIPDALRNILLGTFVGNKTVKFLFGVDIAGDIVGSLGKVLERGLGNALVQTGLGKAFVQPVFVTNPGFGGGGLPGEAAAAGGGASLSGLVAAGFIAATPILAAEIVLALNSPAQIAASDTAARQATAAARGIPGVVPAGLRGRAAPGGPSSYNPAFIGPVQPAGGLSSLPIVGLLAGAIHTGTAALVAALHSQTAIDKELLHREKGIETKNKDTNQIALLAKLKGADLLTVADAFALKLEKSNAPYYQSVKNQEKGLAALQRLQKRLLDEGDTKTAAKIGADIKTLINSQKPPVVNVTTVTNVTANSVTSTITKIKRYQPGYGTALDPNT